VLSDATTLTKNKTIRPTPNSITHSPSDTWRDIHGQSKDCNVDRTCCHNKILVVAELPPTLAEWQDKLSVLWCETYTLYVLAAAHQLSTTFLLHAKKTVAFPQGV
jgi:hypothetical protein